MFRFSRLMTATAIAALWTAGTAAANDIRLAGTAIPASACIPGGPEDDAKLTLNNGAWVFVNGASGVATLQCPVEVKPDGNGPVAVTSFRVYYRDPSSTGICTDAPSSFNVRLRFRNSTSAGFFTPTPNWNSDCGTNECNPGNFCLITTEGFQRRNVPLVHGITGGRLYHFFVALTREMPTDQSPAFAGIDFTP